VSLSSQRKTSILHIGLFPLLNLNEHNIILNPRVDGRNKICRYNGKKIGSDGGW